MNISDRCNLVSSASLCFVSCLLVSFQASYHDESMHDQEADFGAFPCSVARIGPEAAQTWWCRGCTAGAATGVAANTPVPSPARRHCAQCPPSLRVWTQPYTWKYGCMRAHRIKKQTGARLCCQHHVFVHRCVCSALCMRTQSLRLARVCQVEGCNSATTSLPSECGFGMNWRRF